MRKTLICILAMIISGHSFSQKTLSLSTSQGNTAASDTLIQRYRDLLKKNQVPNLGIPNTIQVKPALPVYRGNNGQGSDIYESRTDNMPILVPDSGFVSNMPNGITGKIMIVPYSGTGLNDLKTLIEKNRQPPVKEVQPWDPKTSPVPKKTIIPKKLPDNY